MSARNFGKANLAKSIRNDAGFKAARSMGRRGGEAIEYFFRNNKHAFKPDFLELPAKARIKMLQRLAVITENVGRRFGSIHSFLQKRQTGPFTPGEEKLLSASVKKASIYLTHAVALSTEIFQARPEEAYGSEQPYPLNHFHSFSTRIILKVKGEIRQLKQQGVLSGSFKSPWG